MSRFVKLLQKGADDAPDHVVGRLPGSVGARLFPLKRFNEAGDLLVGC